MLRRIKMALKDKLIDMGGYTDSGRSKLRGPDREVGPSQARMKGIKTAIPVSTMMANKLDEIETSAKNKNKTEDKKIIPMTAEDKKVLNSNDFKKASEATVDKKKGGKVKCMVRGGGIEVRGKTRGKIC